MMRNGSVQIYFRAILVFAWKDAAQTTEQGAAEQSRAEAPMHDPVPESTKELMEQTKNNTKIRGNDACVSVGVVCVFVYVDLRVSVGYVGTI